MAKAKRAPSTTLADDEATVASTIVTNDAFDDTLAAEPPVGEEADELPLTTLAAGRYRIDREMARGGFGRVYAAHDTLLDREVAIKVLSRGGVRVSVRFRREALLTAKLQHPAIVPVHDRGVTDDGAPYYVMRRVAGRTLAKVVEQADGANGRLALLPQALTVAEAVAYAHESRVVHRDLKPQNVVVGAFGETFVVDWGLAKHLDESEPALLPQAEVTVAMAQLTRAGAVLGTPAYMAPEQARADTTDERTDVYALGALLYHVLSGHPPYHDAEDTLQAVSEGPPRSITAHDETLAPELVAIVDKALSRDPANRYAHAGEVADDLRSFLEGRLVAAHQYSPWALLRRWLARHRSTVAAAGLAVLLLAVGGVVSVLSILDARDDAQAARVDAEAAATLANKLGEASEAQRLQLLRHLAEASIVSDPTSAMAWLKRYLADTNDVGPVRVLAESARSRGVARHVFRDHGDQPIPALAASRDGKRIASGGLDGSIVVRDVDSGAVQRLTGHDDTIAALAFTPNGSTLRSMGRDGRVGSWRVASEAGQTVWRGGVQHYPELDDLLGVIWRVAFNESATRLVVPLRQFRIGVVDIEARKFTLAGAHDSNAEMVAFVSDDAVVSGDVSGSVRYWNLTDGRKLTLREHGAPIRSITAGGGQVAVGSMSGVVGLWDEQGEAIAEWRADDDAVASMAFAPDASELAIVADGQIHFRSSAGQVARPSVSLMGANGGRPQYSRDGRYLMVVEFNATLRVVDLQTNDAWSMVGHHSGLNRGELLGDGWLASAADDGAVRLWSLDKGTRLLSRGRRILDRLTLTRGGKHVVVKDSDRNLYAFDIVDGKESKFASKISHSRFFAVPDADDAVMILDEQGFPTVYRAGSNSGTRAGTVPRVRSGRFSVSPDGRYIAVTPAVDTLAIEDRRTGEVRNIGGDAALSALCFDSTSSVLFIGRANGRLQRYQLADGSLRQLHRYASPVDDVVASTKGQWLAVADNAGNMWSVDPTSGASHIVGKRAVWIRNPASDPGGGFLGYGTFDTTGRVTEMANGKHTILRGHFGGVQAVVFSAQSDLLVTPGQDGSVRLWDRASGQSGLLYGHHDSVASAVFVPQAANRTGRFHSEVFVSADEAGGVRRYTLSAPADPAELAAWLDEQTSATIDLADRRVATPAGR